MGVRVGGTVGNGMVDVGGGVVVTEPIGVLVESEVAVPWYVGVPKEVGV
jgi:hypothetical protein